MNPLHEMIKRLPPRVEFLIVVSWAFGLPIFRSILSIGGADGGGGGAGAAVQLSNHSLTGLLIFELVQSLFLIWFLRIRGWTLEKVGLHVNLRTTLMGSTLLVITYLMFVGVEFIATHAFPVDMQVAAAKTYPMAAPDLSMSLVFVVSTVNGIFEEVFVAGYIITALTQARSLWAGINVSTGVRLLCHLYQGPLGIMASVPLGLLFGYVYGRTRQLWPLVFAHIVVDIIALTTGTRG